MRLPALFRMKLVTLRRSLPYYVVARSAPGQLLKGGENGKPKRSAKESTASNTPDSPDCFSLFFSRFTFCRFSLAPSTALGAVRSSFDRTRLSSASL